MPGDPPSRPRLSYSVVIPTKDRREDVDATLKVLLGQSRLPDRVVIADASEPSVRSSPRSGRASSTSRSRPRRHPESALRARPAQPRRPPGRDAHRALPRRRRSYPRELRRGPAGSLGGAGAPNPRRHPGDARRRATPERRRSHATAALDVELRRPRRRRDDASALRKSAIRSRAAWRRARAGPRRRARPRTEPTWLSRIPSTSAFPATRPVGDLEMASRVAVEAPLVQTPEVRWEHLWHPRERVSSTRWYVRGRCETYFRLRRLDRVPADARRVLHLIDCGRWACTRRLDPGARARSRVGLRARRRRDPQSPSPAGGPLGTTQTTPGRAWRSG